MFLETSLYSNKNKNKLAVQKFLHKKKVNMEAIELPCMKLLPTACLPTCAMPKSVGLNLYQSYKCAGPSTQ